MKFISKVTLPTAIALLASLAYGQNSVYQVKEDETLSEILVAQGFPESYVLLEPIIEETISLNPEIFFFPNPDLLEPGDELTLPVNPFPRSVPVPLPETELEILGVVEPAARIVVTKGSYLVGRGGVSRPPTAQNTVFVGDTVETQKASVVRVLFADQSVFSMGSESRLYIEEFVYAEERPESGFRASLRVLLGAISGVSGIIGSDDRDQHSISTPISVIGLRGTEYTIRHCEFDCGSLPGTALAVTEGLVVLENDAGEAELGGGEFVQAISADALSPVTDIPEGFLDLELDPENIEVEFTWWQRFLNWLP